MSFKSIFGKKSKTKQSSTPGVSSSSENRKNSFENKTYVDEFDVKVNKRIINTNSQNIINDTFGTREEEQELKHVQEKIAHVENQSLESTRRALRMILESEESGEKTAAELYRQGEQLKSIDENLDSVEQKLKDTEKNIKKINSGILGGMFSGIFSKNDDAKNKSKTKQKYDDSLLNRDVNVKASSNRKYEHSVITGSDREKEMNDNLDEISKGLSRLTAMANDMTFEIDKQAPIIAHIDQKVERNRFKIDNQNVEMRKNLKN